jgi:hypothetical protein
LWLDHAGGIVENQKGADLLGPRVLLEHA